MLYFEGARKPNFSGCKKINYDDYWLKRGFAINHKLKEREKIILDWIKAGSKVMDVGCGNSLLPVKIKAKGCAVAVADISKIVLAGYEPYGIKGEIINLEEFAAGQWREKFDYIILSEVLEHLKNPEEIVSELKTRARYLIITVPNSAYYRYRTHLMFNGRFFTQWALHPSEHLRYWSHLDFLDWLAALSLKVIGCRSANGLTVGPAKLFNFWKNLFGNQICYLVETEQ